MDKNKRKKRINIKNIGDINIMEIRSESIIEIKNTTKPSTLNHYELEVQIHHLNDLGLITHNNKIEWVIDRESQYTNEEIKNIPFIEEEYLAHVLYGNWREEIIIHRNTLNDRDKLRRFIEIASVDFEGRYGNGLTTNYVP
jgi:hypothetical protein